MVPPQGDLGERYKYDEDERSGDGVQYIEEETSGADTSAKRPTVQQYINSGGTLRTREVATECNTSRKKLLVLIPVIRDWRQYETHKARVEYGRTPNAANTSALLSYQEQVSTSWTACVEELETSLKESQTLLQSQQDAIAELETKRELTIASE
jgi:hypothetical protein